MTETFKIRISREKAVSAYLAEIDDNRGNGHYKIDVAPGVIKFYQRDVWDVEPHFAQAGNYYPPEYKVDEFGIREYFNEDEIYDQDPDIGHIDPGTPDEEVDEIADLWNEIVSAAVVDHVETEDGERRYDIIWTKRGDKEWQNCQ